jgi:hypothetical protein
MTSNKFSFPGSVIFPNALERLQIEYPELFEPNALVSGGFGFRGMQPKDMTAWFAKEATSSAMLAAEQLGVFGGQPDGAVIAIWKAPNGGAPVVYLGSEGSTQLLATDFAQFLRLLAVGYEELREGNYEESPEQQHIHDEDEGDTGESNRVHVSPRLLSWLANEHLSVPVTGEDIVSAAVQAHPDFAGWCEDASDGTLCDATWPMPVATPVSRPIPEDDLWAQMVGAIGKRVNAPEVSSLLQRLGAKPLKSTNPMNSSTYVSAKQHGIEISADCCPIYRPYWPPRRDGRIYMTYVDRICIEGGKYAGPLPAGLTWDRKPERGRTWPSPRDGVEVRLIFSKPGKLLRVDLSLPKERDFITAWPDGEKDKPLVNVEKAFFATWCVLNGLLAPNKFTEEVLSPWRRRESTPLELLQGPFERLLWSNDVCPEYLPFVSAYYDGFRIPEERRWLADVQEVFGSFNHFRDSGEPMTPNSWEAFDQISLRIEERFRQWRQGDLESSK